MLSCAHRIDITPAAPLWLDGMIRSRQSEGVHDRIFAKALALASSPRPEDCFILVSLDLCGIQTEYAAAVRREVEKRTGVPADHLILAATHTHSAPSVGLIAPPAEAYLDDLRPRLVKLIVKVFRGLSPAVGAWGAGLEHSISHYRRLMADDGHVVMNWEPYPPEHIIGPLGKPDPEVLALVVKAAEPSGGPPALMFNHAGHPNVLSGDNYALSADYPGLAERLLEHAFGGLAMFVNGAQGSTDIDGLKDRDDAGLQRVGTALADAVGKCVADLQYAPLPVTGAAVRYSIPARKITDAELRWAKKVIKNTGGAVDAVADGVGDDYKARHYLKLRENQDRDIEVEQVAVRVGDCAIISFPGELFTEIGARLKSDSPFPHTLIAGLANGYIGYIPTAKAVLEGGYEPDTRRLDASAEQIVLDKSLELLNNLNEDKQPPLEDKP